MFAVITFATMAQVRSKRTDTRYCTTTHCYKVRNLLTLLDHNLKYPTKPDEALWAPTVVDNRTNLYRWVSSPAGGYSSSKVRAGSEVSHHPLRTNLKSIRCGISRINRYRIRGAHRSCWLATDRYAEVPWHVSTPSCLGISVLVVVP